MVYSIFLFSKYLGIGAINLINKSPNAPVSYHIEQTCAHGAFWNMDKVHSEICDIVPLHIARLIHWVE